MNASLVREHMMGNSTENRLIIIAKKLRDVAQDIENLAGALAGPNMGRATRERVKDVTIDVELVNRLRGMGRDEAQQELINYNHKKLGMVVRSLGGSSEESKKTKDMMMKWTLNRLFDYAAGHKLLRGENQYPDRDG